MGTRNLTLVVSKGKTKIAQYGQWDGYPTGQGYTIADFLKTIRNNKKKFTAFQKQVDSLEFLSDAEKHAIDAEIEAIPNRTNDTFKTLYPELSRDTGAEILKLVASGNVKKIDDNSEFIKDNLFCEWAYKIDLDKQTVQVFAGTKKPIAKYTFKEFTKIAMKNLENNRD